MRFEEHCQRTEVMLGDRFEEVHIWLDHFAFVPSTSTTEAYYDSEHRRYRHHMAGIERVWSDMGWLAAVAATRHVLDDLFGPLCNDVYKIPVDEADFVDKFL